MYYAYVSQRARQLSLDTNDIHGLLLLLLLLLYKWWRLCLFGEFIYLVESMKTIASSFFWLKESMRSFLQREAKGRRGIDREAVRMIAAETNRNTEGHIEKDTETERYRDLERDINI